MAKGIDTGTAFFKGLLSKITDPEQRAAAEKLLANPTVMTEIGNGVEGQAEIDRQLSALRTQNEELTTRATELEQREGGLTEWHERLAKWHKDNKAAIEEAARLKADPNYRPNANPNPAPNPAPPTGFTEEVFAEKMQGERAAFLGFSRDQNLLTRQHYAKFSEIVDLEPLLRHPKIAEVGLVGVYELVHKDRLDKWKTDTDKAAEDRIRADERQKVLESQAQMPYPPPTGAGSGSPLDALTPGNKDSVVDAATAHYARLQAERAAGTPATK
jgi:hypothetical protein